MNGKNALSDVKTETTYNIPLVLEENVISSGIILISLWHTLADKTYRVFWPQDKKKPLIASSWVAIYTLQGSGKILLRGGDEITLSGNCAIFLKPVDILSYHCEGLVWEQYWMEFIPNCVMEIPLRQKAVIHNGEGFNHELLEVSKLLDNENSNKKNLAVAFLTKMIYQWICLISENGIKPEKLIKIERLLSLLHADLQTHWRVAEMAAWMQCSEQYLRRLFLKYTGKSPKEYYLDARLELAQSLLQQEEYSVSLVAERLHFFDSFHFSKAFKQKFGYAPSTAKARRQALR
ncbi:AraC family transcriptional regulator [Erwinia typographi]|uniref:AraC family transcriptional regulator n=1 Tax=Erwinia typographi TaxID=371042 RepID=A0A0A3Z9Q2_9GAMM|nr:AraC family transcriptional regulator [Erwinia typographi]KGT94376.1 AraC family transcriptional regulator [Erwinia typographi]